MTYAELKSDVTMKLRGDVSVSDLDASYWPNKINSAFISVVADTVPEALIVPEEEIETADIYRWVRGATVDDDIAIRAWELPSLDADVIDMDSNLCYALSAHIAFIEAENPQRKAQLMDEYNTITTNHNWKLYENREKSIDNELGE